MMNVDVPQSLVASTRCLQNPESQEQKCDESPLENSADSSFISKSPNGLDIKLSIVSTKISTSQQTISTASNKLQSKFEITEEEEEEAGGDIAFENDLNNVTTQMLKLELGDEENKDYDPQSPEKEADYTLCCLETQSASSGITDEEDGVDVDRTYEYVKIKEKFLEQPETSEDDVDTYDNSCPRGTLLQKFVLTDEEDEDRESDREEDDGDADDEDEDVEEEEDRDAHREEEEVDGEEEVTEDYLCYYIPTLETILEEPETSEDQDDSCNNSCSPETLLQKCVLTDGEEEEYRDVEEEYVDVVEGEEEVTEDYLCYYIPTLETILEEAETSEDEVDSCNNLYPPETLLQKCVLMYAEGGVEFGDADREEEYGDVDREEETLLQKCVLTDGEEEEYGDVEEEHADLVEEEEVTENYLKPTLETILEKPESSEDQVGTCDNSYPPEEKSEREISKDDGPQQVVITTLSEEGSGRIICQQGAAGTMEEKYKTSKEELCASYTEPLLKGYIPHRNAEGVFISLTKEITPEEVEKQKLWRDALERAGYVVDGKVNLPEFKTPESSDDNITLRLYPSPAKVQFEAKFWPKIYEKFNPGIYLYRYRDRAYHFLLPSQPTVHESMYEDGTLGETDWNIDAPEFVPFYLKEERDAEIKELEKMQPKRIYRRKKGKQKRCNRKPLQAVRRVSNNEVPKTSEQENKMKAKSVKKEKKQQEKETFKNKEKMQKKSDVKEMLKVSMAGDSEAREQGAGMSGGEDKKEENTVLNDGSKDKQEDLKKINEKEKGNQKVFLFKNISILQKDLRPVSNKKEPKYRDQGTSTCGLFQVQGLKKISEKEKGNNSILKELRQVSNKEKTKHRDQGTNTIGKLQVKRISESEKGTESILKELTQVSDKVEPKYRDQATNTIKQLQVKDLKKVSEKEKGNGSIVEKHTRVSNKEGPKYRDQGTNTIGKLQVARISEREKGNESISKQLRQVSNKEEPKDQGISSSGQLQGDEDVKKISEREKGNQKGNMSMLKDLRRVSNKEEPKCRDQGASSSRQQVEKEHSISREDNKEVLDKTEYYTGWYDSVTDEDMEFIRNISEHDLSALVNFKFWETIGKAMKDCSEK